MPPRALKKLSVKSPAAKVKKVASTQESSPADSLPSVDEERITEPVSVSIHKDMDTLETDAAADDVLEEGDASPSLALVEEEYAEDEASDAVESMEDDEDAKETSDGKNNEAIDTDEAEGLDGDDNGAIDSDAEDEEKGDDDHDLVMQEILAEGNKLKESSIYVSGLDKEIAKDDLIKFFGVFGEILSVRIILREKGKKSRGFAFIRFVNHKDAIKALTELKDATEIKGKQIRVQASQNNRPLYIGNISKSWTRDNVIERLKSFGIEQFDNMVLPGDPDNEGKTKGFALLEFNFQADANLAFQRLGKPDADFGLERTAKVGFAHTLSPSGEDDNLQVKTVYLKGIPLSWDDEKVKDICKEYGQIESVLLSRNFTSRKQKDFGFVKFSSRESALACVTGINKAEFGEGDTKVIANISKPPTKNQRAKQSPKGNFKAKRASRLDSGILEKKTKSKPEESLSDKKKNRTKNAEGRDSAGKRSLNTTPAKNKKLSRKATDTDDNTRPYKNARQSNMRGERLSVGFGKPRSSSGGRSFPASSRGRSFPTSSRYERRQAFEPQIHPSDLVPHAGYIPSKNQDTSTYVHDRRSGAYNDGPPSSFGSGKAIYHQPTHRSSYPSYEAGYKPRAYAPRGPYYYG